MSQYEEKIWKLPTCAILLTVIFLILYCPFKLGDRELYWQEGYYAAQAMEIDYRLPMTFAHGVVIQNSYPMFPWLASFVHKEIGLSLESSLRIISVVALGFLTLLVWYAAKRAGGAQAAAVAAAVLISSNIMIEKSLDGFPETLMLLFLTAGWLLWFFFGAGKGNWNAAWLFGLFFCGLAFYTYGFQAALYFILPLIFMRRPLTIWPKLRKVGFALGLAVFIGFVLLWGLPHLIFANTMPFRYLPVESRHFYGYLGHLINFPFDVLFRFLPWTPIAWAPFCVALFPLDKTPIFSRFLRTIFFSLFILLWISPYSTPRDIILLAPPLAIMTGLNYWLIVRRYGHRTINVLNFLSWVAVIIGIIIIMFFVVPENLWSNLIPLSRGLAFKSRIDNIIFGFAAGSLVVIAGLILLTIRRKPPVWAYTLILICAPALLFWTINRPYKAQENEKSKFGRELRAALDKAEVSQHEIIYKGDIQDLYGECFYMGGKVRKISSLEALPKEKKIVYLISTEFPQVPDRRWRNLLPTRMQYRGKRICLWQGIKIDKKGRRGK